MSEDLLRKFAGHDEKTPEFSLLGTACYGRLVSLYDGDTITVVMPFAGTYYKFSLRIEGIDTCEMKAVDPRAKAIAHRARDRLAELCTGMKPESRSRNAETAEKEKKAWLKKYLSEHVVLVYVKCGLNDKYGRVISKVSKSETSESFADVLLREKLAYPYMGDTKLTEAEQVALME